MILTDEMFQKLQKFAEDKNWDEFEKYAHELREQCIAGMSPENQAILWELQARSNRELDACDTQESRLLLSLANMLKGLRILKHEINSNNGY